MSLVMFRRVIKDLRWTVFWYSVGLIAYILLLLSAYPSIRESTEQIEDMLENYPDAFLEAFGVSTIATLPGFIGAEILNVIWPLIVSIFVIMAGSSVVAREIDQGTIELWLSVPVSRVRLLSAKLVGLLFGIATLVGVTVAALIVGVVIAGERFATGSLLALIPALLGFPVAVAGYSALLSSLFSERGKAAGIAAAVTLGFYLLWVFGGLIDGFEWLRYLTIFTAYKPQQALETGNVPWLETLLLLAIGVAAAAGSLLVFQRRDANP